MGLQEPKYRVVYNWIVDSMSNGSLKLGARLPSENELSQRFQLSRQTIRHAIDTVWSKGNKELFWSITQTCTLERPTNSQFIIQLAEYFTEY